MASSPAVSLYLLDYYALHPTNAPSDTAYFLTPVKFRRGVDKMSESVFRESLNHRYTYDLGTAQPSGREVR